MGAILLIGLDMGDPVKEHVLLDDHAPKPRSQFVASSSQITSHRQEMSIFVIIRAAACQWAFRQDPPFRRRAARS